MHFTLNRIEKKHELENMTGKKPHQSNPTGTNKAYYPNKDKDNAIEKNIRAGNLNKFLIYILISIFLLKKFYSQTEDNLIGLKTDIKILDKIRSKILH